MTVVATLSPQGLEAVMEVDETDIPNVKIGQAATVTVDAYPNKTFAGKVRDRLEVPPGITEDELRALALASDGVVKALDGREPRTVVVRAPKLVNVVV